MIVEHQLDTDKEWSKKELEKMLKRVQEETNEILEEDKIAGFQE